MIFYLWVVFNEAAWNNNDNAKSVHKQRAYMLDEWGKMAGNVHTACNLFRNLDYEVSFDPVRLF